MKTFTIKGLLIFLGLFALAFTGVLMFKDPQVDLSEYHDVIPSYKAKIKELRVATRLLHGGIYTLRHKEGLDRLKTLADDPSTIAASAKKTLYYYYGQPERWQCAGQSGSCAAKGLQRSLKDSKKAFFWARQLEGDEKTSALGTLIRDQRFEPLATEADRIHLMQATEVFSTLARDACLALAYHHLDKRYFSNDMIGEANLWLDRAAEIDNFL